MAGWLEEVDTLAPFTFQVDRRDHGFAAEVDSYLASSLLPQLQLQSTDFGTPPCSKPRSKEELSHVTEENKEESRSTRKIRKAWKT